MIKTSPKFLFIFLHGYGADGQNMAPLSHLFQQHIPRSLCLTPNGFSSLPSGGFQWFPLASFSADYINTHIQKTAPVLESYIRTQQNTFSIPPSHTHVIGFSQGGMLALSLKSSAICSSVVSYAGGMPLKIPTEHTFSSALLFHTKNDNVVPFSFSENAHYSLANSQLTLENTGGHTITSLMIDRTLTYYTGEFL